LGARAIRDVQSISIDLSFLGACAVSDQAGVRAFIFEDAEFKQALVGASRAIALAATTEKLGTTAPFHVALSSDLDLLIVEADAPPRNCGPSGARVCAFISSPTDDRPLSALTYESHRESFYVSQQR
jgi:DeoR/GlpR family transcriptional regulator of sugar metabolism